MTSKIYKSAQGKSVDLGTIVLQNEHVRAVGNMKVNARGDKIDSMNRVIETKSQQIQKQNDRATTQMSTSPAHSSSAKARQSDRPIAPQTPEPDPVVEFVEPEPDPVVEFVEPEPVVQEPEPEPDPVVEFVEPEPVVQAPARVINTFAPKPTIDPAPTPVAPPAQVNLADPVRPPKSPAATDTQPKQGGLAGAIARTREIKQDLDRTRRQKAQDSGVRKI